MTKRIKKGDVPKFPAPCALTQNGWERAKEYVIWHDSWIPEDLEDCWSACNGMDGFGHDDQEMDKVRARYGEVMMAKGLGSPRLILLRPLSYSPLMAKLWYLRTMDEHEDVHAHWAATTRTIVGLRKRYDIVDLGISAELIDWGPSVSKDSRYEFSVELVSTYVGMNELKAAGKIFARESERDHLGNDLF